MEAIGAAGLEAPMTIGATSPAPSPVTDASPPADLAPAVQLDLSPRAQALLVEPPST